MSLYDDSRMREQGRGAGGPTGLPMQLRAIAVVLVVGALLLALLGVVSAEGGVRFALIVLVAYAAVVVVTRVLSPFGRLARAPRRRRRWQAGEVARPAFVERAARELELASGSAVRFESERARALLGDEAWGLLERPLERDKFAPGPSPAELDRLLAALERV